MKHSTAVLNQLMSRLTYPVGVFFDVLEEKKSEVPCLVTTFLSCIVVYVASLLCPCYVTLSLVSVHCEWCPSMHDCCFVICAHTSLCRLCPLMCVRMLLFVVCAHCCAHSRLLFCHFLFVVCVRMSLYLLFVCVRCCAHFNLSFVITILICRLCPLL